MGQTCCGGTPEGHEMNNKLQKPQGETKFAGDPEAQKNQAVITMQRYWKGVITRRIVREQYGFVARAALPQQQLYTQSDAQVMEARRLVM